MPESTPKTILAVDDDPGILDAVSLILEEEGYRVRTCSTGRRVRALDGEPRAAEPLPDLILLDIRMSGADGRELCRLVKSRPETRHIPVVIVSADRNVERLAAACEADGVIAKPFEMTALLAEVQAHLA